MQDDRRMSAVALWVADLEKSASFYRDVIGIPIEYSDPHEPENVPHYEIMWGDWGEHGPVEPYLWFNIYASPDRKTSGAHVSIRVPDVDRVIELAGHAGIKVVTEPNESPFGGRRAVFEDPDGNLVEISDG
jgi:catechol 2,3-dioxygenase-like lactoylglutathione lyase family enzyme